MQKPVYGNRQSQPNTEKSVSAVCSCASTKHLNKHAHLPAFKVSSLKKKMTFCHWPDGLQSLILKGQKYAYQTHPKLELSLNRKCDVFPAL